MRIFGGGVIASTTQWAQRARRTPRTRTQAVSERADLAQRHIAFNKARRNLEALAVDLEPLRSRSSRGRGARAIGQADLSVDPAASTLSGTEEVNTAATSYSPHHPDWNGSKSTAPIEVSGIYDGRYGSTRIEFRARRTATVGGSRSVQLDVYVDGRREERLSWSSGSSGPTTSRSGLVVDLGDPGTSVRQGESFFVDVSDTVGTSADPDAAMNTLESELETTVSDGSFVLEGQTIEVFAADSIQDVMDRINAASTGVTASLAGDLFVLTRDQVGEDDIALGSDTSGFLDAMKLSGATVVLGRDDDVESRTIEEVAALASVSSGGFTINGERFAVDVTSDSLGDVLTAINASEASVTASLDTETGRLRLVGRNGGSFELQDDTGLFRAFGIEDDTYTSQGGGALRRADVEQVEQAMRVFLEEVNGLLSTYASGSTGGLRPVLSSMFEDSDLDSGWGLELDLDGTGRLDSQALRQALARDPESVFDMFLGAERGADEESTGLLDAVIDQLRSAEHALSLQHGYSGLFLNIAA